MDMDGDVLKLGDGKRAEIGDINRRPVCKPSHRFIPVRPMIFRITPSCALLGERMPEGIPIRA